MTMNNDFERMMRLAPRVKLEEVIEPFDRRNTDNQDYPFYGINRDKEFMPSVANTSELNRKRYKVIKKDEFVFSGMQTGRDVCIRIGLFHEDSPALLSPAYWTFRVKEKSKVLPKYIFIQFLSSEKDRLGWFLSDSSVRSNLDWERFCDMEIPLPSIEVQRELVAVYEGLRQMAEQNEAMLKPLADACHAYIVDCKEKYPAVKLGEYIEIDEEVNRSNQDFPFVGININKEFMPTSATTDGLNKRKYKIMRKGKFVFSGMQTGRDIAIRLGLYNNDSPALISPAYTTFSIKKDVADRLCPEMIAMYFSRKEMDRLGWFYSDSSVRSNLDWERFCDVQIPLPPIEVQQSIVSLYRCAEEAKAIAQEARELMRTICPALIQRAAQGAHA